MENLVKVSLMGDLGKNFGENWEIVASNLGDCVRCIENTTKRFYKYLLEQNKLGARYRIIINGEDFSCEKKGTLGLEDLESAQNSGLMMNFKNLRTIDIVPVLEGNDSKVLGVITTIVAVILIVVGAVLAGFGGGVLVVAGLGLLGAGITSLLSRPPKFAPFQQAPDGQISYLFSGPTNTTNEGGPVPVGYGRLLIGSQVISAAYIVQDYNIDDKNIIRNNYPHGRHKKIVNKQFNNKIFTTFTGDRAINHELLINSNTLDNLTQSYNTIQSGSQPNEILTNGFDVNVNIINRN